MIQMIRDIKYFLLRIQEVMAMVLWQEINGTLLSSFKSDDGVFSEVVILKSFIFDSVLPLMHSLD